MRDFSPLATTWIESLWRAAWQGGLAILLAWIVIRSAPKLSPRVSAWLLRIACLKLFVTLCWASPIPLPLLSPPAAVPATVSSGPAAELATPFPESVRRDQTDAVVNPDRDPAVPVSPAEPPVRAVRWATIAMVLWLGGVLWQIGRTLREARSVRRRVRASFPASSDRLRSAIERQTRRMNVEKPPRLLIGEPGESPFLAGCLSPAIVLPADMETRFGPEEIELILAHELGHFVRRDLAWNWLPTVAGWLFFFHPLVWLLARQWSETQEAACDELVLNAGDVRASDYGRMLLRVATTQAAPRRPAFATAGVLGSYDQLERRIQSLESARRAAGRGPRLMIASLLAAGAIGIIPWRLAERSRSALAEEPVRLSEAEWRKYVVEIHGSRPGIHRTFPAIVVDCVNKSSYLLSSSWGAIPFPDGLGPMEEMEIVGSGATVEIVGYDETVGTALFLVHTELTPVPAGAWGGDIQAGDVLKELKLPHGEETGEHRVRAVGQDVQRKSATGEPIVVADSVILESSIWKTVNQPGSLFLKEGRLVGLRQDNAKTEDGTYRPHLLPMSVVKKAYAKLRQSPAELATAQPAAGQPERKREPRPGDYQRPELVALAWDTADAVPQQQDFAAWRPDGTILDAEETKRLAADIGGFTAPGWRARDRYRPLILVFRLDDRIRSPQVVMVNFLRIDPRENSRRSCFGSGFNSTGRFLAKSSLEPGPQDYLPLSESFDIEARVPVAEPVAVKVLEGEPKGAVEIEPGIRWSIDSARGVRTVDGRRQSGFSAGVLEIDRRVADPLATVWVELTTKDGRPLPEEYVTNSDSEGNIEIRVSRALDEANPIVAARFFKREYRIERYRVIARSELKPKDTPPFRRD